jgi:hypothetical protein
MEPAARTRCRTRRNVRIKGKYPATYPGLAIAARTDPLRPWRLKFCNTVTSATQTITGYQAGPGWDPVTGWGSPNAQVLVPLLARYASP